MIRHIEKAQFLDEPKIDKLQIITKAREQSNITNSLKGILSHIKKMNKQQEIKNNIIKSLTESHYYEKIYNIYSKIDQYSWAKIQKDYYECSYKNNTINGLTNNDIKILILFNYAEPSTLNEFYKASVS